MMKREWILLSIIVCGRLQAAIEWIDDSEPSFAEMHSTLDENYIAVSDFVLDTDDQPVKNIKQSSEDVYEISDYFMDPARNTFADVDINLDEPPEKIEKELIEEIIFVKEQAPTNEIAVADTPFVVIPEVDPLGEPTPIAEGEEAQMVYFPPTEGAPYGFYLSSHQVTNQDYEVFVKATHHRPPPHWLGGKIPAGKEGAPVVNVTYKDAFLYSIWVGKRLPKESELKIAIQSDKPIKDGTLPLKEWTSTPSFGKNPHLKGASNLTINSELARVTFHKVYCQGESEVCDSNSYNNSLGFRLAINAQ